MLPSHPSDPSCILQGSSRVCVCVCVCFLLEATHHKIPHFKCASQCFRFQVASVVRPSPLSSSGTFSSPQSKHTPITSHFAFP